MLSSNNLCYCVKGIDCGDPGEPVNGNTIFTTTFVDDIATFECDPGFELFGDSQRTCQMSGSWTGAVPECRRKNNSLKLSRMVKKYY